MAEYEWRIRRAAPLTTGGGGARECDERIGRYCIFFETGHEALPAEPKPVTEGRDRAIAALLRAAAAAPDAREIVYPLVRYLPLSGRAGEAVDVARAYARASRDTTDAWLVSGFALHMAGVTEAADTAFRQWIGRLPADQKARVSDLNWLLGRREGRRYERLPAAAKAAYETRVWNYADPLYLTPGNEVLTDHWSRHALGRILAEMRVRPGESWGRDSEELTVRYGPLVLTTRRFTSGMMSAPDAYTEHWDPTQRTYVPPVLDSAIATAVRTDTLWPLDTLNTRSGHAPPTIRGMRVLEHQAARFGNRLVVVGRVATDSAVRAPMSGAVFLLDSMFQVLGRAAAPQCATCPPADSAVLRAEIAIPAEAAFYSAELYDPGSKLAARARYALPRPRSLLSDILLAQPFESGRLPASRQDPTLVPLARPVVTSGGKIGIYTEIERSGSDPRSVRIELETRSLDRPSAVSRAVAWVGQKLGLGSPRGAARLGWSVELESAGPTAIPITLDTGGLEPGRYVVEIRVDMGTGQDDVARREFVVISAPSS